ncbi:MAG TPA: pyridoxal phosphate-dependent aminotransferase [Terriglobales bacterium]|jgi:histidinol-phosphate aminotransferase|nr:pyridoxal phosphate-dependent aminotransferase [Terriglobales bacterium]
MASEDKTSFSSASRRSFLSLSAAASAAVAFRIVTEPMLAHARQHTFAKDAIRIDANENPLGPSAAARAAAAVIVSQGGRYSDWLTDDLAKTLAEMEGLTVEQVRVYPGSSEPLHHTVCAFASSQRGYVTADPGYEAGIFAAQAIGAKVVKVPLTKTYAHDVKAMLAAAPDAGVFYVCSPNNPTGTLTSHSDIEYLVDNKPKSSVVLVDEAYIHFCDAPSVMDLVKAGKEVILLRTFSKIYGMAGLRCGAAFGRPDLLDRIENYAGWNAMPITALVAASASLKDAQLVPERKRINARVRGEVFAWLDRNRYSYIPSQANFFMLDTKRPAKPAIDAMAKQNVFIGRIWPSMPTYTRVTIGTTAEMEQFQVAWQKVMTGAVTASVGAFPGSGRQNLDGIVIRS